MKTELSSAAQAVKDAALAQYADCNVRKLAWPLDMPVVAAALRAAADQMSCYQSKKFLYSITDAMKLLAIAAELEAQS